MNRPKIYKASHSSDYVVAYSYGEAENYFPKQPKYYGVASSITCLGEVTIAQRVVEQESKLTTEQRLYTRVNNG